MGTQPNEPMPNYGDGYPPPPEPQSTDGRTLGLAGLILGIIALVLFWIPLLNFVSLVLALVGLGLSIASLVIVRRRAAAQGLSIAAVIVSAVALIAAILATLFWSSLFNSVDQVIEEPLPTVTVTPPAVPTVTPSSIPPVGPTTTPTTGPTPRSSAAPNPAILPLGTEAEVGDYAVAVSSVQLDATDAILGFNEFNQPPEGQYVLVTLDVVYNGTEEGDPWLDLNPKFVGSDNRQYDQASCLLDLQGSSLPTLENGGAAQYEVCMDVPAAALPGKRILIENTVDFSGTDEASWETE
ncbi:hypothetical protein ACIQXM_02985 [Arthrobacter sp. NPDC097144]|uniref:hypothetical protein n=1 Tax=Arthrobacter sp. NPDC097144 TaxID=3363946 RepID=UPI0038209229